MKEALTYIMNLHCHKFWYRDYEMFVFPFERHFKFNKSSACPQKKFLICPNIQKQTNLSTVQQILQILLSTILLQKYFLYGISIFFFADTNLIYYFSI